MKEETVGWWNRCCMEGEQIGGGRGWMEEEQTGWAGRGVGWKRKQKGWWKRCWMEEEIDGTVEEVLDGRRTGGMVEEVLDEKETDGGRWKRNRRGGVEEVLDGRGNRWDGGRGV